MKPLNLFLGIAFACAAFGCSANSSKSDAAAAAADTVANRSEAVISTIMERRSIRKYKPQPVNRDTMQMILKCGINAPNGMNKQSWEVRVVDNPEFIDGITAIYKKYNPEVAADASFKNMFRNAPTVVFIANDPSYDCSQIDCGLLGGNMILAAQSMGIGSCCLVGGAVLAVRPALCARPRLPNILRNSSSARATSCSTA